MNEQIKQIFVLLKNIKITTNSSIQLWVRKVDNCEQAAYPQIYADDVLVRIRNIYVHFSL